MIFRLGKLLMRGGHPIKLGLWLISKPVSGLIVKKVVAAKLNETRKSFEDMLVASIRRIWRFLCLRRFLCLIGIASVRSFSLNHFNLFLQFPYLPCIHYGLWVVTLTPIVYSVYALFFILPPAYNKDWQKYEKDGIKGIHQFHENPTYSYYRVQNFINSSYSRNNRDNGVIITTVGAVVNIVCCMYKENKISGLVSGLQFTGFVQKNEKILGDNCGQVYDKAKIFLRQ